MDRVGLKITGAQVKCRKLSLNTTPQSGSSATQHHSRVWKPGAREDKGPAKRQVDASVETGKIKPCALPLPLGPSLYDRHVCLQTRVLLEALGGG